MKFLLGRGANASIKNDCGEKPIDTARRKGHSNVMELLTWNCVHTINIL
ncbi:ankyrin repeat domain-containing protein [Wolbachia endosymbiont of Brugia malayi]|nr:ankyrin repeat domain-containing protein [Wolbachia endosymbiont of Brugia malayi]